MPAFPKVNLNMILTLPPLFFWIILYVRVLKNIFLDKLGYALYPEFLTVLGKKEKAKFLIG